MRGVFSQFPESLWPITLFGSLALLILAAFAVSRLYDPDRLDWGSGQIARTLRATTEAVIVFALASYAFGIAGEARLWLVLSWLFAAVLVSVGRLVARDVLIRFNREGIMQRPTLIVGSNAEAAHITSVLAHPGTGFRPVGYVSSALKDQLSLDFVEPTVPNYGSPRDIAEIVKRCSIDTVVIVASAFNYEVLDRLIADLRGSEVSIRMATGLSNVLSSRVIAEQTSGIPMISVKPVTLTRHQLMTKRAFDLIVAGVGLVVISPLLFLLAALIKLTSPGPVFFMQDRVGKDGREFKMYKFRSMVANATALQKDLKTANEAEGLLFKMKQDPRVTPLGRLMRRLSLDELPQLINVVQGDMSLVGPRPALPSETAWYGDRAKRRFEVVPGMTGMWQVSGRSELGFEEMIDLDLFYIENWSVLLDMSMLAWTIPAVLSSRGAY